LKKIIIIVALNLLWSNFSFADVSLFTKVKFNKKIKDINSDFNKCLTSKDKKICNDAYKEFVVFKENKFYEEFRSSNKCNRGCKRKYMMLSHKSIDVSNFDGSMENILEKLLDSDGKVKTE